MGKVQAEAEARGQARAHGVSVQRGLSSRGRAQVCAHGCVDLGSSHAFDGSTAVRTHVHGPEAGVHWQHPEGSGVPAWPQAPAAALVTCVGGASASLSARAGSASLAAPLAAELASATDLVSRAVPSVQAASAATLVAVHTSAASRPAFAVPMTLVRTVLSTLAACVRGASAGRRTVRSCRAACAGATVALGPRLCAARRGCRRHVGHRVGRAGVFGGVRACDGRGSARAARHRVRREEGAECGCCVEQDRQRHGVARARTPLAQWSPSVRRHWERPTALSPRRAWAPRGQEGARRERGGL